MNTGVFLLRSESWLSRRARWQGRRRRRQPRRCGPKGKQLRRRTTSGREVAPAMLSGAKSPASSWRSCKRRTRSSETSRPGRRAPNHGNQATNPSWFPRCQALHTSWVVLGQHREQSKEKRRVRDGAVSGDYNGIFSACSDHSAGSASGAQT